MINLDPKNGHLIIDNNIFTPKFTLSDVKALCKKHTVNLIIDNPPYKYFQIANLTFENYIAIGFKDQKVVKLSLGANSRLGYLPFEMEEREKIRVKLWLDELGGSKVYNWGKVEYSEDSKGGVISIVITYF